MKLENESNPNFPHLVSLSHFWPVRSPRPCLEKLAGNVPLLTG